MAHIQNTDDTNDLQLNNETLLQYYALCSLIEFHFRDSNRIGEPPALCAL